MYSIDNMHAFYCCMNCKWYSDWQTKGDPWSFLLIPFSEFYNLVFIAYAMEPLGF